MSTETAAVGSVELDETATDSQRGPWRKAGRIIPNLVLIRDMGVNHVEFRVQCEVWLTDENEIAVVEKALRTRTGLEEVRELVKSKAEAAGSSEIFKSILDSAFRDNQSPFPPRP